MLIVLTGVSGAGKTAVGAALARTLRWRFIEGDDFHPRANIEKMRQGMPLTDKDREPWLRRLRAQLEALDSAGENAVLTCSALKASYRSYLANGLPNLRLVYLRGSQDAIRKRLQQRAGHFMPATLLCSQFGSLEEPGGDALTVDVERALEVVVRDLISKLIGEPGRRGD